MCPAHCNLLLTSPSVKLLCTPVSSLNSTILCLCALVTLAIFRTQLFSHNCSHYIIKTLHCVEVMENLGSLVRLQHVDLSHNSITSVGHLTHATTLKVGCLVILFHSSKSRNARNCVHLRNHLNSIFVHCIPSVYLKLQFSQVKGTYNVITHFSHSSVRLTSDYIFDTESLKFIQYYVDVDTKQQ